MAKYKEYVKSEEGRSPIKNIPEEFINIELKEVLHNSLKQLLEEVLNTNQPHFKIKHLSRANEWYNAKIKLIDAKLLKKPLPPQNYQIPKTRKELKKQMSMQKQREEIDADDSPRKKIKLEKSPMSKKPVSVMRQIEPGEASPFKKYYEDGSVSKKKSYNEDSDDNFADKIISLKETKKADNDYEMPYIDRKAATRRALNMWKTQREKKITLNRSEEQLMRSLRKWGNHKSKCHERQLMSNDRHSIAFNEYSRRWNNKPIDKKMSREEIAKSFNISHDQFLDTDNESLKSSDRDDDSQPQKGRNTNADYSFDDESHITNLMNRIHDMSYLTNDHDVMFSSSFKDGPSVDDSFFLTKKNVDGDASPTKKKGGKEPATEIKSNAQLNPLRNLNRIQKLRHMKGHLLSNNKFAEQDEINNIFNTETGLKRNISLSLYTRPKSLLSRKSVAQNYYGGDNTLDMSNMKNRVQRNGSVEPYQSTHSQHRTHQIDEITSLQRKLTSQDIN